MKKTLKFFTKHKVLTGITVVVIIVGGYFWYSATTAKPALTKYVTSAAMQGTLVVSVSDSGQVSSSNQANVQPQASGSLTYLGITQGKQVYAGQVLARIDDATAQKSVRDAQQNLDSQNLTYQTLVGSDPLNPQNVQNAKDALAKAYTDGLTAVSNAFLDLPDAVTGLNQLLLNYAYNLDPEIVTYYNPANVDYQNVSIAYTKNFTEYRNTSFSADPEKISSLISETYQTTVEASTAEKSALNLIEFYKNSYLTRNASANSSANSQLTELEGYIGKTNSDLSSLLNAENTISSDKTAVTNAQLNIKSAQISLQQKQNALSDAQSNLADYTVTAPFSGTIAKVAVQNGDAVSSGTTIAILIAKTFIAQVSLNEVDVSKVKIGQQATLTFDALPDLSIAGKVTQIDTLGTVSQGVVSYNVQITFETQDVRVKPGMSVTAAIITNIAQNVIVVPSSAIKTSGQTSYVQVLVNGAPVQKTVQPGLSNATQTAITSGLNVGDNVITQTITAGSSTSTSSASRTTSGAGASSAQRTLFQLGGGLGR